MRTPAHHNPGLHTIALIKCLWCARPGADGEVYVNVRELEQTRGPADDAEEAFHEALLADGHELIADNRRLRAELAGAAELRDLLRETGAAIAAA
jgi:hypothetical protein